MIKKDSARVLAVAACLLVIRGQGLAINELTSRPVSEIMRQLVREDDDARELLQQVFSSTRATADIASYGIVSHDVRYQRMGLLLIQSAQLSELIPQVTKLLDSKDLEIRMQVVEAARRNPSPDAEEIIRRALSDKSGKIRAYAMGSMAKSLDDDQLSKGLTDKTPEVLLTAAIEQTRRHGKSEKNRRLAKLFMASHEAGVRVQAIALLGINGVEKDGELLKPILAKRPVKPLEYIAAFQATKEIELSKVAVSEQQSFLFKTLSEPGNMARRWAIDELARRYRSGDSGALEVLKRVAGDVAHSAQEDCANAVNFLQRERR